MNSKFLFVFATALLFSHYCEAGYWSTFRGGFENTGSSSVNTKESAGKAKVSAPIFFSSQGIVWGSPVLDEQGNSYVGSADKHFYKFSPEGKLLWSYKLFDRADSLVDSAAVLTASGKVIVPGGDGFLHALDKDSGKLLWTFKSSGASDAEHTSGVIVNSFEGNVQIGPSGTIYAGSDNGYMYAVDDTGQQKWSFKTGMMIWSSPCFDKNNHWMAFGSLDGKLYVLDPTTGKTLAVWDAKSEIKSSPTTDGEGHLYFGTSSGKLMKLIVQQNSDGLVLKKEWEFEVEGEIYSSPAYKQGKIYFGSLSGTFYSLDESGKLLWKFIAHSPLASSPIISADDTVFFGAKNGKMYALNAMTGERRWSTLLVKGTLKSNLDSSPALRQDGVIVNGSYSGNIYFLPVSFCANNPAACETKGWEDIPAMEASHGDDQAIIQVVDKDGSYRTTRKDPISTFDTVQLKLFAFEKGHLIDRAAASSFFHSISISPEVPMENYISSDGSTINIRAIHGFEPGTKYKISASGKYYVSSSWLADRFKWLGLKRFSGEIEFQVKPLATIPSGEHQLWGIQSLYLIQPKALDTYIPAALDGQGFLASSLGFDAASGRFILLVHPALPSSDGVPKMLEDASNAFLLTGTMKGDAFRADGSMTVAAMGGTIPFKRASFSGVLDNQLNFTSGEYFTTSSCFDIKGNGSNYSFPTALISQVCDSHFRLICLGTFKGKSLPIPPATASGLVVDSVHVDEHGKVEVSFGKASKLTGSHLISVVRYDAQSVTPSGFGVALMKNLNPLSLSLKKTIGNVNPADTIEVYVDQSPAWKGAVK